VGRRSIDERKAKEDDRPNSTSRAMSVRSIINTTKNEQHVGQAANGLGERMPHSLGDVQGRNHAVCCKLSLIEMKLETI
jgi:hypothetical protein